MLDLNRLISFVIYSPSSVRFREVKDIILELVVDFDNDDMAIIADECYQGSGPITAAVANSKRLQGVDDFVTVIKDTVKTMGDVKINCPKIVFIMTDSVTEELQWVIAKLERINSTFDYPVQIHLIELYDEELVREELASHLGVTDG